MGFYIRKSIKFGPIRFNISKSGIGISSGIRGARISTGPRGTYVNVGRNGIYYRKKIDEAIHVITQTPQNSYSKTSNNFDNNIPASSATELIESSKQELLTQINSRIHQPTYAFLIGLGAIIIAGGFAFVALIIPSNFILIAFLLLLIAMTIGAVGLYLAWGTYQQEKLARTTALHYNLDEETKSAFTEFQNAFSELAKAASIWQVISRKETWDWKRNAGASSLITRSRVLVGVLNPPFLQTQVRVYGFSLGSIQFFFLPDQLFFFQNNNYGVVSYNSLNISTYPTRYIESQGVPGDSTILTYTWQYVRKDGGPDRRFANNRQLPVVQYGQIEFSAANGLNLHFQVSNPLLAQKFSQAFLKYVDFYKSPRTDSGRKTSSANQEERFKPKPDNKPQETSAYSILNVTSNASRDEITSAYKKMAQQYHPDKVAGLGPELKELAEKRMKEINAAYQELMKKFID